MKIIISILCLIASLHASAQNDHQIIEVDHFGNIYTIKGLELTKYTSNKKKHSNFSDALLGEITAIDVSNPLRIQLFYKEFNQVVYLDQNLSSISDPIDLYTYSNNETQVCCNASSGGMWIYNSEDNQAFKISKQGETLNKSGLLTSYFTKASPTKMIEYQEKIYILTPSQGLVVLNKFGQFIQQIPLAGIIDFCFNNQKLDYLINTTWYRYNPMMTSDSTLFQIKDSGVFKSRISGNKIYIFSEDQISIRSVKD